MQTKPKLLPKRLLKRARPRLMLLVLVMSLNACVTEPSKPPVVVKPPVIPQLPLQAQQPQIPNLCVPNCSTGLGRLLSTLQPSQINEASRDKPVSMPTKP